MEPNTETSPYDVDTPNNIPQDQRERRNGGSKVIAVEQYYRILPTAEKKHFACRGIQGGSDWTIHIDHEETSVGNIYHVHKCVLAEGPRRSEYFSRLFDQPMMHEQQHHSSRIQVITKAEAMVFPNLLDYLYDENKPVSKDDIWALHRLADYFSVDQLLEDIRAKLSKDKNLVEALCHELSKEDFPLISYEMAKALAYSKIFLQTKNASKLPIEVCISILEIITKDNRLIRQSLEPRTHWMEACLWPENYRKVDKQFLCQLLKLPWMVARHPRLSLVILWLLSKFPEDRVVRKELEIRDSRPRQYCSLECTCLVAINTFGPGSFFDCKEDLLNFLQDLLPEYLAGMIANAARIQLLTAQNDESDRKDDSDSDTDLVDDVHERQLLLEDIPNELCTEKDLVDTLCHKLSQEDGGRSDEMAKVLASSTAFMQSEYASELPLKVCRSIVKIFIDESRMNRSSLLPRTEWLEACLWSHYEDVDKEFFCQLLKLRWTIARHPRLSLVLLWLLSTFSDELDVRDELEHQDSMHYEGIECTCLEAVSEADIESFFTCREDIVDFLQVLLPEYLADIIASNTRLGLMEKRPRKKAKVVSP